jgi:hypothetical protein
MDAGPIITTVSDYSYKIVKNFTIIGIVIGFSILLVFSVLVHDVHYMKNHPRFFISETLIMAILTTLPIVYLSLLRGANKNETIKGSALIFLKIVLLHIGFQMSGIYSVVFPNSP